uniref:hypothetical protein n=1 Tax=Wolbachia endosymbiont (group B) of Episyrphus balteatus TaxID=2954009 RepID=UPI002226DD98|nr:hypothetical protein [Wolbachia endosymbiont (group B) of Episyrphus balteatus]
MKIDDHRTNKDDFENIEIAVLELVSTTITVGIVTRKRKYSGYSQVRKLHVVLNVNDKKA